MYPFEPESNFTIFGCQIHKNVCLKLSIITFPDHGLADIQQYVLGLNLTQRTRLV
jgi:hypothetical protein